MPLCFVASSCWNLFQILSPDFDGFRENDITLHKECKWERLLLTKLKFNQATRNRLKVEKMGQTQYYTKGIKNNENTE